MKGSFTFAAVCCICVLAAIMAAGCTGSTESTSATPAATVPPTTAVPVTSAVPSISATTAVATMTVAPVTTNVSVKTVFVNSTANGKIITIPSSERVMVALNENPTTGYSWNATVSKGLTIVSDNYIAPNTTLVGAGGYHEWILSPDTVGTYTFKAVYMRSWEGATATDETFGIVIQATPN